VAIFRELLGRLRIWASRQVERGRSSRRLRRAGIAAAIVIVLFGLFGFFGVPIILRHELTGQVARTFHRPITVGDIAFNPYRLRLEVDKLHIGDRGDAAPFVDIGRFRIKVSWKSLFWLAPIVSSLSIDHPDIHIVRTGENRFNFSDLVEYMSRPSAPKTGKPSQPRRFSVSNIQITDGDIYFSDRVLNRKHSITDLRLGIPFIANLPSAIDVFVQPMLQMRVDGSPMRLTGRTKPFGPSLQSIIDLNLHRLDLPLYVGYLPMKLPVKLAQGEFSSLVQLHFINTESRPRVRLDGQIAFDTIDVRDPSGAPLVGIRHASITLKDVEPLEKIIRLGSIYVDKLNAHVVLNPGGTTNLTLRPSSGKPAPASTQVQVSAQPIAVAPAETAPVKAAPVKAAPVKAAPTRASPSPTPGRPRAAASPNVHAANSGQSRPSAAITPSAAASISATASLSPSATGTPAPPAARTGVQSQMIAAQPRPSATLTPEQSQAAAQKPKLDFSLDSFEIADSTVDLTDRRSPTVASMALDDLRIAIRNLHTLGDAPATYELSGKFNGGGTIAIKGNLELAKSQATTDFSLNQLDLAALKAFAAPYLAGDLKSGKLSAQAAIRTGFAPNRFNVHVEPASVSLDDFNLLAARGGESQISWKTIAVTVGQVDLATRTAIVKDVRTDGIKLLARRNRRGQLNLLELARPGPQAPPNAKPSAAKRERERSRERPAQARRAASRRARRGGHPNPPASPTPANRWRYQVASVAVEKTQVRIEDDSAGRPVKIAIDPLNIHLKNISSDLAKPIPIELDATVNRTGSIKIAGTAAPDPLKANIRLRIRRLDLSPVDAYVAKRLNAKIVSAALTMSGVADIQKERDKMRARYRGDVVLGDLRMRDKLTGDNFLRWNSLSARHIDADYGAGPPKVHIGGLALSNFYARIILNSDGRLNLKDIASNPQEAPKSLTRPGMAPAPLPMATPAPSPQPAKTVPTPKPIEADIALGQVTLQGGRINYTDHFIKPHYTADLTGIGGKIGSFGTRSTKPATVALQGEINGSAPIDITGSINPLAPMAFVDLTAKANGVDLPGLTPYSAKYTGYPIIKGTLSVGVHYLLDKRMLTATNHIHIDQLTFGQHVTTPNAANLPVRLAVAVLSDSRGVIDLNVPVSGSLNDPKFSIGAVVWTAFKNLVVRALTSPFTLIASTFGGAAGSQEDLSFIEFRPGYATLTAGAQKQLAIIAKAMRARPKLKLEISGRVDPSIDRDALRLAKLEHLMVREKIKDVGRPKNGAPITIGKDEYDKYLTRAYKAANFPKPRDILGFAKSLPPDQMKKLMLANMDASDDTLRQLAEKRANAVREFLTRKRIDPNRLFIVTSKLNAGKAEEKGKTSGVALSLK
jgi:Domain of Unknown Function (DUF748)